MLSDPPKPPTTPRLWIALVPVALLAVIAAYLASGTVRLVVGIIALLLAIPSAYKILSWRADIDYYDWYHGPGNPDRPSQQ